MEPKIRAKRGLASFLSEISRYSKTAGFHYHVIEEGGKTIIRHHGGKWCVVIEPRIITVTTDTDKLMLYKNMMLLNGKEINELCDTVRCYTARDIIEKLVLAITLPYADSKLLWWVSG